MSDRQKAVLKNLDREIESLRGEVQTVADEIAEAVKAGNGVGHILTWKAEAVIWQEAKAFQLTQARITVAEWWDDDRAPEWLRDEIEKIQKDAMRPRNWVGRSTSPIMNITEYNQFAARVDMVPHLKYIVAEIQKDRDDHAELATKILADMSTDDQEPEGWCMECDNIEHECICEGADD